MKTPKYNRPWLNLVGLAGVFAAYYLLALALPSLAMYSPRLTPVLENFSTVQGFYAGFSLLFALWATLDPASFAVAVPSIFVFIFFLAVMVVVCMASLFILTLMIGLDYNTMPWLMNSMVMSGRFVAPVMVLNALVVGVVAIVAKGLRESLSSSFFRERKSFKQWEILVMLVFASWSGLVVGWHIATSWLGLVIGWRIG